MKNLLLCLCLVIAFPVLGVELDHLDYETYARVGGTRIVFNSNEFYKVTIPSNAVAQITMIRKFNGKPVYSFTDANELPWANREYFIDYLKILDIQLKDSMEKDSSREQLLFAWLLGLEGFKKVKFDIYQLKREEDILRLRLFQSLQNWKESLSGEHPPPLPTDGRNPIPYRYGHPKDQS